MVDVHTKKQRSFNMSKIRGKETKPEIKIKKYLENRGFIYQHNAYGKPDFINLRNKIVLFVDGCFWHKCHLHFALPETNKIFWKNKINKNILHDKEVTLNYKNSGWEVIRIWEHKLIKVPPAGLKSEVALYSYEKRYYSS